MSITVRLSWSEIRHAVYEGADRHIAATYKDMKGSQRSRWSILESWDDDAGGAIAERAFAKWFGAYWSGTIGRIDQSDAAGIEVKSTKYTSGMMIVQVHNPTDAVYVLVTPPDEKPWDDVGVSLSLRGWISGAEAKSYPLGILNKSKYGKPAHLVPQEDLHPMETLKEKWVAA